MSAKSTQFTSRKGTPFMLIEPIIVAISLDEVWALEGIREQILTLVDAFEAEHPNLSCIYLAPDPFWEGFDIFEKEPEPEDGVDIIILMMEVPDEAKKKKEKEKKHKS